MKNSLFTFIILFSFPFVGASFVEKIKYVTQEKYGIACMIGALSVFAVHTAYNKREKPDLKLSKCMKKAVPLKFIIKEDKKDENLFDHMLLLSPLLIYSFVKVHSFLPQQLQFLDNNLKNHMFQFSYIFGSMSLFPILPLIGVILKEHIFSNSAPN